LIKSLTGNEVEVPTETHDDGGQHDSEQLPRTSCQGNQDTKTPDNSGKAGMWSVTILAILHVCVCVSAYMFSYVCVCTTIHIFLIGSIHYLSVDEGFSNIIDNEGYEYECLQSGHAFDDGLLRF
jgi:hypothetical protein